jgi:transcriptional regulator with XRE-family HTH domain
MSERWSRKWRPLDHDPAALRWAREVKGWSQARLAREIGISRSSVCEIEAGGRNANHAMITRLAEALGCPATVLMREKPAA